MPSHDIIDNRSESLAHHVEQILQSSERAHFAVGYFFLSGLTAISKHLGGLKELRLLIGNSTNQETLEQLTEGYRRLDKVAEALQEQQFRKRAAARQMANETAESIRSSIELMEQTDQGEQLVATLVRLIQERKLHVRVYTRGRMHAKAYIFDYGVVYGASGQPVERHEKGIAIVGSSNLTLSGVTHNTELNVVVNGNDNHERLGQWFDELWDEAEDFSPELMNEMSQAWPVMPATPYDVYMKTLFTLVQDRLEGTEETDVLWDDEITSRLADFQKVAVRQASQIIKDYGGAFVADVVGLGKSYIGAAIIKHFERTEHARPLVICPAPLVEMWERYNELYDLNARVLSSGYLQDDIDGFSNILKDHDLYRDRDFVLLDESHHFRRPETQRYRILEQFLATGKRCCFLTATPQNQSIWDIYNQIKLFHQDDVTELPIDPPNLREYFRLIEKGERELPDLLVHILIRRTRNHILRWYGYDAETDQPLDPAAIADYVSGAKSAYVLVGGRHQFFPKRELETVEYSIEAAYQGLYQHIRGYLGKQRRVNTREVQPNELSYARYGLWHYVADGRKKVEPYSSLHRAGQNLRGLIRTLLFKRFESSVYAFRQTISRMLAAHEAFVVALDAGFVPAGEEAQSLLMGADLEQESRLLEELEAVSTKYRIDDFNVGLLRQHIEHDINLLKSILDLIEPISAKEDAKLQRLIHLLRQPVLENKKVLVFSQYADTAQYIYENLNPGDARDDIGVINQSAQNKTAIVGRFAPKSNPEYRFRPGQAELSIVVATDVLSEGLNLQDCNIMVNYDLHWNPVRLIQRFGRIDRIGTEHQIVYGYNFLPETGIEKNLGLRAKLSNRIQEIHDAIGEDAYILDKTETLNTEAMYAIYERGGSGIDEMGDGDGELLDLNEAEEILRALRNGNPDEFARIANLRDGIRSARKSQTGGTYVFCRAGRYQRLYVLSTTGTIVSTDTRRILGLVRASQDEVRVALPSGHNDMVSEVKRSFAEDAKARATERDHSLSLSQGQRYVVRELRQYHAEVSDEDIKQQISILDRAFRKPIPKAVNRELNKTRANSMIGKELFRRLSDVYLEYQMAQWSSERAAQESLDETPRIICTEAFV